jgi:hypothetical protein
MVTLVFNLFSEFTETIGYKQKREAIKKSTSFQTIRIRGFYKKKRQHEEITWKQEISRPT